MEAKKAKKKKKGCNILGGTRIIQFIWLMVQNNDCRGWKGRPGQIIRESLDCPALLWDLFRTGGEPVKGFNREKHEVMGPYPPKHGLLPSLLRPRTLTAGAAGKVMSSVPPSISPGKCHC